MKDIGKHIKEIRASKGLSQEELAEKASVNIRSIQRIENNHTTPRGKTLQLIGSALEINLENFLAEENSTGKKTLIQQMVYLFFFILIQLSVMTIYGFMTLDSESTLNSKIGGLVISLLLPFIVVMKTCNISGTQRFLKYGSGLISYVIMLVCIQGWNQGITSGIRSGLFLCILLSLSVLYFGNLMNQSNDE